MAELNPATASAFAELVKAFDQAMPDHLARAEASLSKPEATAQVSKNIAAGLWSPQQFAITDLLGGFCKDWLKYRAMIVKARWVIRVVAGASVASAIMSIVAMADAAHAKACAIPPVE